MKHWLYLIVLLLGMSVHAQQTSPNYLSDPIAREYIRLAESYLEQGKTSKAMKQLNECIKTAPVTYAYWLRGSNLYNQGKWKKSMEDLSIVVADSVGIPVDIHTSAKTMLAQAQKKRYEQKTKRIGRLGIYGTAYIVGSSAVKISKIVKQSVGNAMDQHRQNTAGNDSTTVVGEDGLPEKNLKNQ